MGGEGSYNAKDHVYTHADGTQQSMSEENAAGLLTGAENAPAMSLVVEKKEEDKAGVAKEAASELAKAKTEMDLDQLKAKMQGDQFEKLASALNLGEQSFDGPMPINIEGQKDLVASKVLALLKSKEDQLKPFASALSNAMGETVAPENVDELVAQIYAVSILRKAENDFKAKYPRFSQFQERVSGYQLRYEVKLNKFYALNSSFISSPPDFDEKYKKFEEENPVAKTDEKEKAADPDREAKIKALKNSFLGNILVALGFIKKDEFGQIIDGEQPLLAGIIGLFGGGAIVGNAYEDMVKDLDGKYKGMAIAFQEKARKSFLSLSNKKVEAGAGGTASAEQTEVPQFDNEKFAKVLSGATPMPDKGLKLKSHFDVPAGQKLALDLSKGGEIILPKGSSFRKADGTQESAITEDKTFKEHPVEIAGQIPKGVRFNSKVQFKLETKEV